MKSKRKWRVVNILAMGLIILLTGIIAQAKPKHYVMRVELDKNLSDDGYHLENPTGNVALRAHDVNWDQIIGENTDLDSNYAYKDLSNRSIWVTDNNTFKEAWRAHVLWVIFDVYQNGNYLFRYYAHSKFDTGIFGSGMPATFEWNKNDYPDDLWKFTDNYGMNVGYRINTDDEFEWDRKYVDNPFDDPQSDYHDSRVLIAKINTIHHPNNGRQEIHFGVDQNDVDHYIQLDPVFDKSGISLGHISYDKVSYWENNLSCVYPDLLVKNIVYKGISIGRVVAAIDDEDSDNGRVLYKAIGCDTAFKVIKTKEEGDDREFLKVEPYVPAAEKDFTNENFDEYQYGFILKQKQDGFSFNGSNYELVLEKPLEMSFPYKRELCFTIQGPESPGAKIKVEVNGETINEGMPVVSDGQFHEYTLLHAGQYPESDHGYDVTLTFLPGSGEFSQHESILIKKASLDAWNPHGLDK